ncbi:response regulator transcription factor [Devosia nitrariae]|uniref:Response regulatory domain-containing protein n=1 Tax=Devosia nitrariae TaxID=2071872 RepID=A0ABQ5WA38_9HYPH|nr:response regulator [Devosia nitrariae]GLQ56588.1 hypothetical protein GCM10010862_38470 [Devosia nitrariae]
MPQAIVHVIDDDEAVRDSLDFLLGANQFQVKTYTSGRQFLETWSAERAACVICDIRMPELSGLEVVSELRRRGYDLPVIIMTGHGDMALAAEVTEAGADGLLEKPFSEESLLAALHSVLSRSI